uniref:Uncharacterized protein n=1 Tax=Amphimedon queenslandica TaxID=400682 RepID=A0A1X7TSA2_AMPQE
SLLSVGQNENCDITVGGCWYVVFEPEDDTSLPPACTGLSPLYTTSRSLYY